MSNKNNKNDVDLSLRQFIKDLGCVAGGAALLNSMPWLQSFTPAAAREIKKEKARMALIGTGSRGLYHIHNLFLIPHAEIVALCDDYAPNLKAASELVPKTRTYTDYHKLLEAKDIDGVIISTPLNWHAPMVLDSLAAGKHVFCEKAMADSLQACKDIYNAYQETDKVLYFCMQRMFDEKYIKGMQMIRSGLIGDVVGCRMHWFRNHNWRRPVPSRNWSVKSTGDYIGKVLRSDDRTCFTPNCGLQLGNRTESTIRNGNGRYCLLERRARSV